MFRTVADGLVVLVLSVDIDGIIVEIFRDTRDDPLQTSVNNRLSIIKKGGVGA